MNAKLGMSFGALCISLKKGSIAQFKDEFHTRQFGDYFNHYTDILVRKSLKLSWVQLIPDVWCMILIATNQITLHDVLYWTALHYNTGLLKKTENVAKKILASKHHIPCSFLLHLTNTWNVLHVSETTGQCKLQNVDLTAQTRHWKYHIFANRVCHRSQPANTRDSPHIQIEPPVMHTIWWHNIDYSHRKPWFSISCYFWQSLNNQRFGEIVAVHEHSKEKISPQTMITYMMT